ncbi:MAG: DUF86 domain-containing protein [Acidimicrobiales bacterium]|nr:DUF86 domain-containing protein [Acidimicrobiales bacterium]
MILGAFLWDARQAAGLIVEFLAGRSWDDYENDALVRSAVERQFEIVGEALNQFGQTAPDLVERIPDLPRIVAFRNVLIHEYTKIDDRIVWEVAAERVPALIALFDELIDEIG